MRYIAFIFAALVFVACSGGEGEGGLPPTTPPVKPTPPTEPTEPEEPVEPTDPTYNVRYVSSVEELNSMTIASGDMVILANGTYDNKTINIKASGTADKPIIVKAATAGKVIFTGSSRLLFSGSYMCFEGFWFKDVIPTTGAVIEFRSSSNELANNCAVRKCAITGYNTHTFANERVDYKWVSVFGFENVVEKCSFTDKRNMGTLLVVWLAKESSGQPVRHKIRNNYFSRPKSILGDDGKAMNGQETIRIGTSEFSMQRAECLVEGNVFYKCDGEVEAISNKSCFNTYHANLFENCAASLTLRHGTDCLVENNLFIGNGVKNSGGVRIIDKNHVVKSNYMENLKGNRARAAICLMRGYDGSPASGYFQVSNAVVKDNTIVNCYEGINANYGDEDAQVMPVVQSTISNNIVTSSNTTDLYVTVGLAKPPYNTAPDITWSGNRIYQGKKGDNVPEQGLIFESSPPPISSRVQQIAAIKAAAGVVWSTK